MDGADQLSPDEYLLRRIPARFVDMSFDCPIQFEHFNPSKEHDQDGISMFRALYRDAKAMIADAKGKGAYYIARATVEEIRELGLTPTITVSVDHTSLPELSWSEVQKNDDAAREKKWRLAELMSKQIILGPLTAIQAQQS